MRWIPNSAASSLTDEGSPVSEARMAAARVTLCDIGSRTSSAQAAAGKQAAAGDVDAHGTGRCDHRTTAQDCTTGHDAPRSLQK
ncbi:hypothetical protein MICRO8M_60061 [Microbacterium sp. 8M]|nr:hypothetical protein MICRO8M_60061 [Microbacterium sp. 8M]